MAAVQHFVQNNYARSPEWAAVLSVAKRLEEYLSSELVVRRISEANVPGASSSTIESIVRDGASALGFGSNLKHLFQGTANQGLRPDLFLRLENEGTGILLEVERGKTVQNNMDLLDFWKCHICEHAHYLFLVVPEELRQNSNKSPSHPYRAVLPRLEALFCERNYTNVRGVVVFGY
jgi:hypothetical protein